MDKTDLYWLAGFMEGEGYFGVRGNGSSLVVQVGGVDEDVIRRAQVIMRAPSIKKRQLKSGKTFYSVTVCQQKWARDLMLALLPLMGERRAATIRECLEAREKGPVAHAEWTHCKNGHPFSGANLKVVQDGKYRKRRCLECARQRQRKYRTSRA